MPIIRLAILVACAFGLIAPAHARITRLEILRTEPAFGGRPFTPGAYDHLIARAYGELDPADPRNAIIQDLWLAPRNARGMVEYTTDVEILKPADQSRGNRVLFVEVANRGNKTALASFNNAIPIPLAERNALTTPGDGWLMNQGYTLIWFGWEQDVLPGDSRITMPQVVAHNPDGSPITGVVRSEMATLTPVPSLPIGQSWQTRFQPVDAYPSLNLDNRAPFADGFLPSLTVRAREQDPRVLIPNAEWRFAKCTNGAAPVPDPKNICLNGGFQPGLLYELIYRARDPLVLGLGFAAARDLGAFLRNASQGNPIWRPGQVAVIEGSSQDGRFIRTMIHLGFNQAEDGSQVYDGAYPHIGGGLLPLNVRFGQPGRAWGEQTDHTYPAYDFPFTYTRQHDPLTGRTQGLLDRCTSSGTCPLIFHVATVLEMWEGRQSLGLTDPLGRTDVPDPPNVRTYIMASTQHAPAPLPLATKPPFGVCQQQPNPNPQLWTMRALLTDFTQWVRDGVPPPPSVAPRIAEGTLVAPDQVHFPPIPATNYGDVPRPALPAGARPYDTLHVLGFGPLYHAEDSSGVITIEPPLVGTASYGVLEPQVDADGNDTGGIRSVFVQAPIGTYAGWNLGRVGWFENGFCNLMGSFIPFASTRAERLAAGDPRPSIEERYPTKDAYVAAFRAAAQRLVAQRFLLPSDAAQLIAVTEREGIRTAP